MKKRTKIFAAIGAAAAASAGLIAAHKAYYKVQFEKGCRVPVKERGIAYFGNEIVIASAAGVTFEQILELAQFVGGKHEYTEERGTGTYTFILLPKKYAVHELERIGDDLTAAFDYVSSAGFHEVEDMGDEIVPVVPNPIHDCGAHYVEVDSSRPGKTYFVNTVKENANEN